MIQLICPVCGARRDFGDLHLEARRRYKQRFWEEFADAVQHNPMAARANYAPIWTDVQHEWRATGCECLGEAHE